MLLKNFSAWGTVFFNLFKVLLGITVMMFCTQRLQSFPLLWRVNLKKMLTCVYVTPDMPRCPIRAKHTRGPFGMFTDKWTVRVQKPRLLLEGHLTGELVGLGWIQAPGSLPHRLPSAGGMGCVWWRRHHWSAPAGWYGVVQNLERDSAKTFPCQTTAVHPVFSTSQPKCSLSQA